MNALKKKRPIEYASTIRFDNGTTVKAKVLKPKAKIPKNKDAQILDGNWQQRINYMIDHIENTKFLCVISEVIWMALFLIAIFYLTYLLKSLPS